MQARESAKLIEKEKSEALQKKLQKRDGMREALDQIKAERQAVADDEAEFVKNKTAFGSFPYTHGDGIDRKRAEAYSEIAAKYKDYTAGNTTNQSSHSQLPGADGRLYPQGGAGTRALRDTFMKEEPFYLRRNPPGIKRKIDHDSGAYATNLENARRRFEDTLLAENEHNKKHSDEYQQYMDEATRYDQLVKVKRTQDAMLCRAALEQQIESDKERKAVSRDRRRRQSPMQVYGPAEPDVGRRRIQMESNTKEIRAYLQRQMRETPERTVAEHLADRKHARDQIETINEGTKLARAEASVKKLEAHQKNKEQWDNQAKEAQRRTIVANAYDLESNRPIAPSPRGELSEQPERPAVECLP